MQRTWITGENGNRASVEKWGSEEAARESMSKLVDCKNCSDCSGCSGCSDCSDCSDCSGCSRCSGCSDCSDCSTAPAAPAAPAAPTAPTAPTAPAAPAAPTAHISQSSFTKKACKQNHPRKAKRLAHRRFRKSTISTKRFTKRSRSPALLIWANGIAETLPLSRGWVVHLAGPAGYALENFHNTAVGEELIYRESGFLINPCRFFDGNDDAMKDMKQLAEVA